MKEPIEIEKNELKINIKFNKECIPWSYDREHNLIVHFDISKIMIYMELIDRLNGKEVQMVSDTKPIRKVEYLTDKEMKKRIDGEVDRLDLKKDGTMALKPGKKSKENKDMIR